MKEYVYPYTAEKAIPHISKLIDAIKRANAKDKRFIDVRPLMSVLKRLPSSVPRLAEYIERRSTALVSTDFNITPKIDGMFQEECEYAKIRLEECINFAKEHFTDTDSFGKLVIAVDWAVETWKFGSKSFDYWTPVKFTKLEPEDTEVSNDSINGVFRYNHDSYNIERNELTETAERSYIIATNTKLMQGGLLRSSMFYAYLINKNIQDWNGFNDRAKGIVLASIDSLADSLDPKAKEVAMMIAENVGKTNWGMVPAGITVELQKMVDPTAATSFDKYLDLLQKHIEISFLGSSATTELPDHGGSRAAVSSIIHGVSETKAYNDRLKFQKIMESQLLWQDYVRNFAEGDSDVYHNLPWRFNWNVKYAQDSEKSAATARTLLDMGLTLSKKDLEEKTGFQILQDDDEIRAANPFVDNIPGDNNASTI